MSGPATSAPAEAARVPRGRFAPSPTGRLHVGNARTALLAWLAARLEGGAFVMRMEDLDRARVVPGAETAQLDDLGWLGIDWDEGPDRGGPFGPYRQSERQSRYDAAVAALLAAGRAFPCACSRAEIARSVNAPHAEDEAEPRYPGTCRDQPRAAVEARARSLGRAPAIRFDGRGARIPFTDRVHGAVDPPVGEGVDDFVLRRADGVAAYQLAVVVDDAAMKITDVVRGDDLLGSTPRQLALYQALGMTAPRFAHLPLLLDAGGARLAKRTRPAAVAALRDAGADPRAVVGQLAASAGLGDGGERVTPADLRARLTPPDLWSRLDRTPAVWRWAAPA